MKNFRIHQLKGRLPLFSFVILLIVAILGGTSGILAQDSKDQAIARVQRAVTDQIISREIGRDQKVTFNRDAFV